MTKSRAVRDVMDGFRKLVQLLRTSHRAAENVHVTGAQLFIISVLADSATPMSIRAIAERTQTDPSTVSVVAGRLVERGLVKRAQSPEDARRAELSLTPKGRHLRKRAPVTIAQQRLANAIDTLSERQIESLRSSLASILEHMGAEPGAPGMMFDDEPPPARRRRK